MENKIKPHEIYTALMIIKTVCEESTDCCLCSLKSQILTLLVALESSHPLGN